MEPTKILLVDDHPIVRAGLRAILEGFADISVVAEASDGAQALETLAELTAKNRAPDVIIMDLQMKPVGGTEAITRIKAQAGPPVLVLTTFDTQHEIVGAIEAGALGYLLKDAPPQTVHTAILNTAAGKRTLAPEVADALMQRMQNPAIQLSNREAELLQQLATGATNRELSRLLFISEATVKTHLNHIYAKLGVDNRTAAISVARERGLV